MTFSYLELVILFFGIQLSILPLTKGYGGPFYEKLTQQDLDETFNKIDESPKVSHVIVLKEPVYLIVAPRIVRAGQPYRLVVNVLPPSPSLMVVATLFKDNIQVDVVEKECSRDEPQIFQIMVPPSSGYGHYRLKLEGNEIGWLTGSAFSNETDLVFSPRGATIFIQLEKKIYSQGSTVKMRIVALDNAMKLVDDSVDVFVLSPRGVLLKKWISRQCYEGAIKLDFPLSRETETGQWKIRVEATNSFSEEYFTVEEFVDPLFEIAVDVPSFLPSSSKYLEGTVSANYSSGAPLAGEVTIKMSLKPLTDHNIPYYGTKPITVERRRKFNGFFKFRFLLDDFQDLLSWSDGLEVRIMAYVKDFLLESSDMGFGTLRIFPSGINLDFLGDSPFIIRPSMPFQYFLIASSRDGSHVSKDLLHHHRLHVTPEVRFKSSKVMRLKSRALKMAHDQYGLWRGEIDLIGEIDPVDVETKFESLTLQAELKDASGSRSYASLVAVAHHSEKHKHLQISTSTKHPKVGEYIILHVRSNFYLEKFRYIVLSKGAIIEGGQERMEASLKTFPLALTSDMAGTSTVIVYALERGQPLVTDALTFHVDALTSESLKIKVKEVKSEGILQISVSGRPGSKVSLTGNLFQLYQMQKENELTKSKIASQMLKDSDPFVSTFNPFKISSSEEPLNHRWISSSELPHDSIWIPKGAFGTDANDTFFSAGVSILSDGEVSSRPNVCDTSKDLHPCLLGGCYSKSSACDAKWDCVDRIDESRCFKRSYGVLGDLSEYYLYRNSRRSCHFKPSWLWTDVTLGREGKATLSVMIPERPSDLVISAFALHPKTGLSLLREPILVRPTPHYWLWVEAPSRVGVWEQVGLRVTVVNHLDVHLPSVIVLANNPKYKFVNLDDFEAAQRFPHGNEVQPQFVKRMSSGEHEHSISVPGHQARTIYFPIVPVVTGEIIITVQASIPGSKISRTTVINSEAIGALQQHHTSMLLDLSSRAYLFTFLDIVNPGKTDFTSSPNAEISLFGDMVGGSSEDIVSSNVLNLPEIGCEPVVFSILMTVLQLNHWVSLSQKPPKNEREIFKHISILYQTLISYQNYDGGFKYFKTSSTSSVWVTSLALRALNEASIEWQKRIYVDHQVTDRALRFLMKQQSGNGAFWEPSGSLGVRILESPSSFIFNDITTNGLNLSSTALTIIQLMTLRELPEPLDEEVSRSIGKGRDWLERNLGVVASASHPLEVSLVALALHLMKSKRSEEAFNILARNARQEVKYVYWGEDLVPLPSYRVESQRPHLQPRKSHRHDSGNIAATACGLRVYASRGELLTPAIVRWLHYQRENDQGWMSTLDTLLAWEALHEYSSKKKLAKYTHLTVMVERMKTRQKQKVFYVSSDNVLHLQKYYIGSSGGSIRVQGKGNGSAVLQMTSKYYTTEEAYINPPPQKAFILRTRAVSSGRNSSTLTIHSCVKWIYTTASPSSGIAVLEIDIPTGYGTPEGHLENYVKSKELPNLRRAKFEARKMSFYFDRINSENSCVKFSVNRWFPVANLTKTLVVKVYEYYSPELFAIEFLDMSSVALDICEVCGSYQCPNCPVLSYYSSSSPERFNLFFNFVLSSLVLLPIINIVTSR